MLTREKKAGLARCFESHSESEGSSAVREKKDNSAGF